MEISGDGAQVFKIIVLKFQKDPSIRLGSGVNFPKSVKSQKLSSELKKVEFSTISKIKKNKWNQSLCVSLMLSHHIYTNNYI